MPHRRAAERIRAEFLEMPGMRLTLAQAQRLWGLDRAMCQVVLDALVDAKFLRLTAEGLYMRVVDQETALARHVSNRRLG